MDTIEIIDELRKRHPRRWVQTLSLLTDERVRELGFKTVKEFVFAKVGDNGLGLTKKEAESLIVFNLGTHRETSALEVADRLGLEDIAKSVPVLGEHGVNQYGLDKNKNVKSTERGGNSQDYRLAKLKRDFGEERVLGLSKECKTVAEMERKLGVGKPLKTPVEKLLAAFERLSDKEREIFKKEIGK